MSLLDEFVEMISEEGLYRVGDDQWNKAFVAAAGNLFHAQVRARVRPPAPPNTNTGSSRPPGWETRSTGRAQ